MPMTRKRQQQLRQQQQQQQQQQLQRTPSQSTTNQQPQLINLISGTPPEANNQQRPMSVDNKQVKMDQSPGGQAGSPPGGGPPARGNNRRGRRYQNQKKVKQNNHNKPNSHHNNSGGGGGSSSNNNDIASSSKDEPTTALIIETALQKDVESVLENDLTCAICREVYINPLILNCSHSFCKFCLTNWLSKQSNCASCRMVAVFQTENLALRNVINKMIQSSSGKYKEERAASVKSRLEAEEKQQLDGIVPMMAKDTCSRFLINGGGLGRRRTVISPWNGSNGATIWRTNLRNNNEVVQPQQARDDYTDDNSSVDSIGAMWRDDALRDVYGNFGDSDDEDDDDYYEEIDIDNAIDDDDIMEEDDDDDDDDDDEVMDSDDDDEDEVDDILSAGMGEIITSDSDTAQSYPTPVSSSSEEEDSGDDDDDVIAHDDDDDEEDSDGSYDRTLALSLFSPFIDPTRHMYSSSDNDSDSDFHVEVVDDSRISPIIQSPSPSTSSSSSSSSGGSISSSSSSTSNNSSNGGDSSDTNRHQVRRGQISIRPTWSERYITVDTSDEDQDDDDEDDYPIISWTNRIETRSRRTRPRD